MTLISSCTRFDLAFRYFNQATSFIPFADNAYPVSDQFDYKSLMVFDSWVGRAPGTKAYPLVSSGTSAELILTGGSADPKYAHPSRLDIKRVMELCPKRIRQQIAGARPGRRSAAVNNTEPEQQWSKVEGPGGFSTIVGPGPTAQPTKAPQAKSPTKRWYS